MVGASRNPGSAQFFCAVEVKISVVFLVVLLSTWYTSAEYVIDVMSMNSGPVAPSDVGDNIISGPLPMGAAMLSNVPTSSWTYGCSATSAGMIFGYYDRTGFPNMYTGPANGGVAPLSNLGGQCSIIATKNGFDGRSVNGHVDDYWISTGSSGPDPWEGNWTEHTWGDCTADYMGTNQWKWDYLNSDGVKDFNDDGSTALFSIDGPQRLNDYIPWPSAGLPQTALCHGMRLFVESRGYAVLENYTQKIDTLYEGGFSFADYMAEINAGCPVMIQVTGHSMVGVGYNSSSQTVYLHDTWGDYVTSMTWGGSYSGMQQTAVTVIHIAVPEPTTISLLLLGGVPLLRRRRN